MSYKFGDITKGRSSQIEKEKNKELKGQKLKNWGRGGWNFLTTKILYFFFCFRLFSSIFTIHGGV